MTEYLFGLRSRTKGEFIIVNVTHTMQPFEPVCYIILTLSIDLHSQITACKSVGSIHAFLQRPDNVSCQNRIAIRMTRRNVATPTEIMKSRVSR